MIPRVSRSLVSAECKVASNLASLPRAAQRTFWPFSSSAKPAAAPAAPAKPDMFCFQCEQTKDQKGCTTVGVCGKQPTTSALQDLIVHLNKGISVYAAAAFEMGVANKEIDYFMLESIFSTLTNVNFDDARMTQYIERAYQMREKARSMYMTACREKGVEPNKSVTTNAFANFKNEGTYDAQAKTVGVLDRKAQIGNEDLFGLQEMCMYGIKGTCAYTEHAMRVGSEDPTVYGRLHKALAALADPKPTVDGMLGLAMEIGSINLRAMELLDAGHTNTFGHPEPTEVNCTPVPGKCILVSGHDIHDLENVLIQTEGKGVNVYTHGELLPANAYPKLKKYKHFVGHFGSAWQNQKFEFPNFPGAILMTTNCLVEPMRSYKKRIFTTNVTGWPGVTHLKAGEFGPLIEAALQEEGFDEDSIAASKAKPLTIGFARNTVMSVAGQVIDAVKAGAVKRFFVIGGCDGTEGERSYFTDLARLSPKDTMILTLGCGKFRFNRMNLGNIGPFPRVLDLGQCNDAYSGVQIAVALANAFKTDVNSLPLSFAVSWLEQKAVAVLLSLLSLGIRNIRLGTHLPGFATPGMIQVLNAKFNLMPVDTKNPAKDLELMMQGK